MAVDERVNRVKKPISEAGDIAVEEENRFSSGRPNSLPQRNLRKQLAIMPMSVLLPELGTLKSLSAARTSLERQLKNVQSETVLRGDVSDKERLSEESMLNQVLQWLSLGREDR